jgi:hypothetical protein
MVQTKYVASQSRSLFFSSMKNSEQEVRGSTPISTNSVGSKLSIEKDNEDLPDPENFGFDVPNL